MRMGAVDAGWINRLKNARPLAAGRAQFEVFTLQQQSQCWQQQSSEWREATGDPADDEFSDSGLCGAALCDVAWWQCIAGSATPVEAAESGRRAQCMPRAGPMPAKASGPKTGTSITSTKRHAIPRNDLSTIGEVCAKTSLRSLF